MSETSEPISPDPIPDIPAPPEPAAPAAAKPRRSFWPALGIIGFLILAAGEVYLWRLHAQAPDDSGQIAALQARVAALQVAPPAAASGAPDMTPEAGAKLGAMAAQVNALQTLFTADHGALITLQANATDLSKLIAQVNAVQTASAADHAVLAGLQASTVDLTKLTAKITVLGRLESARMALDAGQPLGPIPNAPAVLLKYADAPPPTQAALTLTFPAAAQAAESASVSSDGKRSYWSNVLARLENLITISNGTRVIVGAPAAAVIAQARASLNAGDLAGAVAVLDTLSDTTKAAMGDWLTQAQDLLAARAAIVAMAGQ